MTSGLIELLPYLTPPERAEIDRLLSTLHSGVRPHTDYQTRPEAWIVEKLGIRPETLRWSLNAGYDGREWDGTPEPLLALLEAVARGEDVGMEAGTGTQKSHTVACLILWFLACWEGSRVFTFAPKEDQLRLYIWTEIGKLWPRFKRHFPQATLTDLRIRMLPGSDGWGAWGFPVMVREGEQASVHAAGMHAEHMLHVYEEAPGVPLPVMVAGENTRTAPHNIAVAIGNPDNEMDALHQFCVKPAVKHVVISALDHPNVVTGDAGIVPGAASRKSVEERRGTPLFESRVRGRCPKGGGPALPELWEPVHIVPRFLPPAHWPRFGGFDWGHAHPWAFGKYAVDERGRIYCCDTLTGHRMRVDRIVDAIKEHFGDVAEWDYLVSGSDIAQRHIGRTTSDVIVRTIQEQFAEAGLLFNLIDDGPGTRKDRLNNFRDYTGYLERGPRDPLTGNRQNGTPQFVWMDTPGNRLCFKQCQMIRTDPRKAESPLPRDADPRTGEGGDDLFMQAMAALASRPEVADRIQVLDTQQHPGFEGERGSRRRKREERDELEEVGSGLSFGHQRTNGGGDWRGYEV